jgi:hypothetical protein
MEMDSRVGRTRIKPEEDTCKAVIDASSAGKGIARPRDREW